MAIRAYELERVHEPPCGRLETATGSIEIPGTPIHRAVNDDMAKGRG